MAVSIQKNTAVNKKTFNLPALTTINIDSIPYNDFTARKYIIDLGISDEDRFSALELMSSKKGTDVTDTIYSRIGDQINVNLNFVKVGADALLQAVNNETVPVSLSIIKL